MADITWLDLPFQLFCVKNKMQFLKISLKIPFLSQHIQVWGEDIILQLQTLKQIAFA